MPRELKGIVIKKIDEEYTVLLENYAKKRTMSNMVLQTGELVWVSYDYEHQRITNLRLRNKH